MSSQRITFCPKEIATITPIEIKENFDKKQAGVSVGISAGISLGSALFRYVRNRKKNIADAIIQKKQLANLIRLHGGGEVLAQSVENLDQSTTVKLYSGKFFENAIGKVNSGRYDLFQSTITTDKNGNEITTLTKSDLSDTVRNAVITEDADKKASILSILKNNTIIGKEKLIGNGQVLNLVEESASIE